jgi:tetratricopeptide (TPR) repeat protein
MLAIMTKRALPFHFFVLGFLVAFLATIAKAADNWIEIRSAHFTVASNAGEKEARRIADQFEQFRAMFREAFAKLRIDQGQPIVIIAVKNQNTMKELIPEFYDAKGHVHPAGLYQSGYEKHYVLLRLDAESENPYHALYHEYTHALMHLNFDNLPLWLDEGLAEFYGNSVLREQEARVGVIDRSHLYALQQGKLLPIETLLEVGHDSPHYNEDNRASMFYAESWALVHYLMLDPEARQKQLLRKFIASWSESGNQTEAAREAFGDLKKFGQFIEEYARQTSFKVGVIKHPNESAEKEYAARSMSAGEILALRGDFYAHKNQLDRAQPLLEQAMRLEANLAIAHEDLGVYFYFRNDLQKADAEMTEALRLGSATFIAPYFHGMLLAQRGAGDEQSRDEAMKNLRRATQLNPQFAPAFEALAQLYSRSPEMQQQAVDAAVRAVQLDPSTHAYGLNLAGIFLNSNRYGEARHVAEGLLAAANSPEEAGMARELLARMTDHEEWAAQRVEISQKPLVLAGTEPEVQATSTVKVASKTASATARPVDLKNLLATDGEIRAIKCSENSEITLTLSVKAQKTLSMTFHAEDLEEVGLTSESKGFAPTVENCEEWKGHKIRIWFYRGPTKEYSGEITNIDFF